MRRFVVLQGLVWITYGVIHFAASIPAILPEERGVMAIASAVRALTGLGISTVLVPLLEWRRYPGRAALIATAAGVAIAGGFLWMFVDRAVLVTLAAFIDVTIPWQRFMRGIDLGYLFVMLAWATAYVALMLLERTHEQNRALLEQQVDLKKAQLNLLAAQLNPHFLFNSLNTIRSLAAEDSGRTREVVSRLSSFLRRALSVDPAVAVPLEEELDLARDYLAIEQARLESGLEISFDTASDVGGIPVPAMILQPLLENAVKHGDPTADGIRRILVRARVVNGMLELVVRNRGSLGRTQPGKGLELTKARLEQMYGTEHAFDLSGDAGDTVATLILPLSRSSTS